MTTASKKRQMKAKPKARPRVRIARPAAARPRRAPVTQIIRSSGANSTSNSRPMQNVSMSMVGSDFLSIVEVRAAPTPSQRILASIDISPSMFPGTRLTQLSQLYERYRFTNFKLRYVPAVPTSMACQLLVYLDTDPADNPSNPTSAENLIRQATSHAGSQQWNFHSSKVISLPLRSDKPFYYTGDTVLNPRFSLQARAYVVQVTNPVNFNGEPLTSDLQAGSLYIDWTCLFQCPQLNPLAANLGQWETSFLIVNPNAAGLLIYDDAPRTEIPFSFKPNSEYVAWFGTNLTNNISSNTTFSETGSTNTQYTFLAKNAIKPPTASGNSLEVILNATMKSVSAAGIPVATFTTDSAGKADWIVSITAPSTLSVTSNGSYIFNFARIG